MKHPTTPTQTLTLQGVPQHTEFVYRQLGAMATVGGHSAVLELGDAGRRHLSLAGFLSWVAWRSAYLTRLGSIPKRLVGAAMAHGPGDWAAGRGVPVARGDAMVSRDYEHDIRSHPYDCRSRSAWLAILLVCGCADPHTPAAPSTPPRR